MTKRCTYGDCPKPATTARGYCAGHWEQKGRDALVAGAEPETRKRLRALYRRGDQYGRSWTCEAGLPLSFRGWLRFMGYA